MMYLLVSIPSSSGQVFIKHRQLSPTAHYHQCLNPFFIRSSIHLGQQGLDGITSVVASQSLLHQVKYSSFFGLCDSRLGAPVGLNPFFIRSSIHRETLTVGGSGDDNVSIPSSSGQVFIRKPNRMRQKTPELSGLNPFFIRSSIHLTTLRGGTYEHVSVSIPSSSGQVFILTACRR